MLHVPDTAKARQLGIQARKNRLPCNPYFDKEFRKLLEKSKYSFVRLIAAYVEGWERNDNI